MNAGSTILASWEKRQKRKAFCVNIATAVNTKIYGP